MLEKMVFSMELHAGNDPAWLDQNPRVKQNAINYADRILRDLEEAGMLPPEIAEKSYRILPDGEMIHAVNEWEPER
jgi:hypothetical protein